MAAALSAGTVSLPVKPDATGFGAQLGSMLKGQAAGFAELGRGLGGMLGVGIGAGIAAAGVASIAMASDFQKATTMLITGAGESEKNIHMISQGLLDMAPAVGMGPGALAKAMFLVESAGFHGAAGLTVMKAAAEGAKVGGAEATVVANALTTAMTDYNLPTEQAATVTSKLIATVAAGKSNMQDLSGAMSAVAPIASAAGIGLDQMLGAMATMTGEGISAQQSAQNLASTIGSLQNPTAVQTKAMAAMGLSSLDVAKNLGTSGLTGTMATLSEAVMKHMGPAGLVLKSSFNESKIAAASAQEMLTKLPPSLQGLGKEFLNNTITQKEWMAALRGQDVLTSNLGKQFATTAKAANGFSETLRAGGGSAATFSAELADMTGGSTGLNTALALTGSHAETFAANVADIGAAATETGDHVKGWALTQADFATRMDQAKASAQAFTIGVGEALIPKLISLEDFVTGKVVPAILSFTGMIDRNKTKVEIIAGVIGTLLLPVFIDLGVQATISAAKQVAAWAVSSAQAIAGAAKTLASHYVAVGGWVAHGAAAVATGVTNGIIWAGLYAEAAAGAIKTVAQHVFVSVSGWGVQAAAAVVAGLTTAGVWAAQALEAGLGALKAVGALALVAGGWVVSAATAMASGVIMAAAWLVGLGPVGWIIAAVVAVIAAFVAAYNNIGWFRDGVNAVWEWLKVASAAVVNYLVATFYNLVYFFAGMPGAIGKVFGTIADLVKGAFNGVVDFVKGIFNSITGLVNGIIDGINTATSVAGVIGITIGAIPHLPKLAQGGTILPTPGGTIVRVAEGGRAESVVDTGKLNALLDRAGGGGGFTQNVYALPGMSEQQVADMAARSIQTRMAGVMA